ncbi:MAG: hypothetical protein KHZ77_04835 [Veillonella sp.]|uniref:hypothetical protein n=1 Tax=Veillonella sp. TaxID=1926307 RepID=UPI0025DD9052|nr:hypothetical protein [Veillonella sp.]MBS4913472.1 hypothetical protein [Veillonella sp.]
MKKYKELRIGRDGVSEFVEVEAGAYGLQGIVGAAKHNNFSAVRGIKAVKLGGAYYLIVDSRNTVRGNNKQRSNGYTMKYDSEFYNEHASVIAGREIFGNAYVVKQDHGIYRALEDREVEEIKKEYPFPIKGEE